MKHEPAYLITEVIKGVTPEPGNLFHLNETRILIRTSAQAMGAAVSLAFSRALAR